VSLLPAQTKQRWAGHLGARRHRPNARTVDLTDDERAALEGDPEALEALAERLADTPTPTPAGPTPRALGTADAFIPLTQLLDNLPSKPPETK
jgi:hypothetical protein